MRAYSLPLFLITIAACATGSQTEPGFAPVRSTNVITSEEIAATHASNAYEAIERTHPIFLTSRAGLAPLAEREVYFDGIRLGGIATLRGINPAHLREIRFVRPGEGIGGRGEASGGAIVVFSKRRH